MAIDGLAIGGLYTKNYLMKNLLLDSPSFASMFRIVARLDLTYASAGVTKESSTDTSEVYQVKAKQYQTLFVTASYSADQAATSLIAAPGAGKKIVITYLAFRTIANTGSAYLSSGAMNIGTTYFEAQNSFGVNDIEVACPTNTAVTITTSTGSDDFTVAVLYHIEEA